jgi:hypothetical protein
MIRTTTIGMLASGAAAMALLFSAPSFAQSPGALPTSASDRAYCAALSDLYVRYIGHDEGWGRRTMRASPLPAQVAVTECRHGDTAEAIPVLEHELRAQKFTLPQRG